MNAKARHNQILRALARDRLIERLRTPGAVDGSVIAAMHDHDLTAPAAHDACCQFEAHPAFERLLVARTAASRIGLDNPYCRLHDGVAGAMTDLGGRRYVNFSSDDYLGLNGHPRITESVSAAVARYGTSTSASRLLAGEHPVQRELERALAAFCGTEDCVTFVSEHATSISTFSALFGPNDLIVHDALIQHGIAQGAQLSGAHSCAFPHNDWAALDAMLTRIRGAHARVLIVIEGLYGMHGDTPDLARFVQIKQLHRAVLMVDASHALGTLGVTGRGIAEHCGVPAEDVDIWLGTLSKSLASCGGYIAGSRALVDLLKYTAWTFVHGVGLPPAQAAAALEALRLMDDEPVRVLRLQEHGRMFHALASAHGIDTGSAQGHAIGTVITGSPVRATELSNALFDLGVNAMPITPATLGTQPSRVRFALSADHTPRQIADTINMLGSLAGT